MADSGDENDARAIRIRREDLRVECQVCGGGGREFKTSVERRFVVSRYVWPCKGCFGTGRVLPRK